MLDKLFRKVPDFRGKRRLLRFLNRSFIVNAKDFFEFVDWAEKHAGQTVGAAQQYFHSKGYKLYQVSSKGQLIPTSEHLLSGSEMLFASKKPNRNSTV